MGSSATNSMRRGVLEDSTAGNKRRGAVGGLEGVAHGEGHGEGKRARNLEMVLHAAPGLRRARAGGSLDLPDGCFATGRRQRSHLAGAGARQGGLGHNRRSVYS
jgi:hypothetical protein